MSNLSNDVRHAEFAVKDYVTNQISYDDLKKTFDNLEKSFVGTEFAKDAAAISGVTEKMFQLDTCNTAIEKEITGLTEWSLKASNDVIKEISDLLIGQDTRGQVTDNQRAVLVGANMNTNANFRIRLLFNRMKEDLDTQEDLIGFLDTLVANVTKDIELLKGTENEATARKALETNLAVKELVLEFIENVKSLKALETEVSGKIIAIDDGISEHVNKSSADVFGTIKGYFTTIIGVILAVSIIGILVNFFLARTIAGSLNKLNKLVKDLAEGEGDLTKRISVTSKDETGELAQWINLFVEKLQKILLDITGNADALNNASSRVDNDFSTDVGWYKTGFGKIRYCGICCRGDEFDHELCRCRQRTGLHQCQYGGCCH